MATIKTVQDESLRALGDAIRAKTYTSDLLEFPNGMIEAINNISVGSGSEENKLAQLVDGSITEVTAADLGDITQIYTEAFYFRTNLISMEIPDTVTRIESNAFASCTRMTHCKMSKNINYIAGSAFSGCYVLPSLTFGNTVPQLEDSRSTFESNIMLYVPGNAYDNYLAAPYWGSYYRDRLIPYDKYASALTASAAVHVYNQSKTYSVSLQNYDTVPEYVITSSTPGLVNIESSATNTEINLTVSALEAEGSTTIAIAIPGNDGYTFVREMTINVVAELAPSSYTVEIPSDVTYGFELGADGYYVSTNTGIDSSFSYAVIRISNMAGRMLYLDCINYGEPGWDFGILSKVNSELEKNSGSDTSAYHLFNNLSSQEIQTITYTDAVGDCFITVKYIKDGGSASGNDTFRFKVRFGE